MNFLGLGKTQNDYEQAGVVILPVPYEATTSYGKGAKNGPAAILKASCQLEAYDIELDTEICNKVSISTLKPIRTLKQLYARTRKALSAKKFPVILGGEHSISPTVVAACREFYPDLSVLQLDAHADLRDIYKGRKDNHGCAARRILEICPCVQVGIRSLDGSERDFARASGQREKMQFNNNIDVGKMLSQLSKNVYITLDVDVFDPSIVPATGTPEPGGLLWYQALDILKQVFKNKNVVGIDFVELAPKANDFTSDFTIAKLVYKVIGYRHCER